MSSKYDDDDVRHKDEGKWNDEKEGLDETALIESVQNYFFTNEDLANEFERFIEDHAHIVDLDALEKREFKLEYSEVYEKFKDLFEARLENHINVTLKSSIQEFYQAIKHQNEREPDGWHALFGLVLLSVTDFDVFMTMMKEKAEGLRRK